jgi:Membrane bound beta barrel domain (DUF5777)
MRYKIQILLLLVLLLPGLGLYAQVNDTSGDNTGYLQQLLEQDTHIDKNMPGYYVSATFKATRIINGHSIENVGKGSLDFTISHRFGELNEGLQNLYGLDNATTRFGFDYGITDWLMVGVGRSSFEKEYDGFLKMKLLRQTVNGRMPVSVSLMTAMSATTMSVVNIPGYTYYLSNRLFYADQVLIARKFNKFLSLQLMPTYLHYNLVSEAGQPNDVLAMGVGGRVKLSKRIALTAEYYYLIPEHRLSGYYNSASVGIDIETGGHVFQLFLTNSSAISERTFIGETDGNIGDGGIHLGFNLSRIFTVVKPKEFRDTKQDAW